MEQILTKMISNNDYFSIITFSNSVNKWTQHYALSGLFKGDHKMKGSEYVKSLQPGGGTDINSALLEGITQAEQSKSALAGENLTPMITFLTDGVPDAQISDPEVISKNVQDRNTQKIPILTLGFGSDADKDLLQKISAQTNSMSRMISAGADAQDQLEDFFKEIERPTLSNVQFNYLGNVKQDSLSEVSQGQMFSGGEFVAVGETRNARGKLAVTVSADSRDGRVTSKTTLKEEKSVTDR